MALVPSRELPADVKSLHAATAAKSGRATVAVVLIAVIASGCGGASQKPPESKPSRAEQHQISVLSRKCRESKPTVARQLDVALHVLHRRGLGGSRAELADALDTMVIYAGEREKTVECNGLLIALVATIEGKAK